MEATSLKRVAGGPLTLVIGGTGQLGGRVARTLVARGIPVRALVRQGSDAARLRSIGVEVVAGDMLDPRSLDRAMDGVAAVATTAIGYMRRRKGDSLESVDDRGNRNLVDAARRAKLDRFVFTSILGADRASYVPHFHQKQVIEDYLESSGVPFVALRPGSLIAVGPGGDFWAKDLRSGRITSFGAPDARWSYVDMDDVARCAALATTEPRAIGRRVDVAWDRAVSTRELAAVFAQLLGRPIKVRSLPWVLLSRGMAIAGLFNPWMRDAAAMGRFILSGGYIADTSAMRELFGPVPTVEQTLRNYLVAAQIPTTTAVGAFR